MSDKKHIVSLTDRNTTFITSVSDIISFDDTQVILSVDDSSNLSVSGKDLALKRLSLDVGEVEIDGKVDALVYMETASGKRKRRFFG